jgi:hypothetical protein
MANAKFMPGRGMPRPTSPAFTDNSIFAQRVTNVLASNELTIASPKQEDAAWASELEETSTSNDPLAQTAS